MTETVLTLSHVLKAHDGHRVAVDTRSRSYTGRLQSHDKIVCVHEDDETLSWVRIDSISGVRIFMKERQND
ncbi:hypothetical protein UFOVP1305_34 [uncultured Caudovirales phage]|uniref:Uncharacterized protein n=1 Tax=uncultured Caudovirales phage TaxID=2100421 RepID=A0A6J5PIC6_9CAUD|nr:hypothetical protein UFOVP896_72 [uncultured Caudovirales phage]CAB4197803.1 hypothetical protein UFOVP1305_34 [uncultured Caudovirales phage]